jgi:predicted SnoaL-like aldol condensation-catalyzing enzyme
MSITTKIVSSNRDHDGVYSIQHYVIKFVSERGWDVLRKYRSTTNEKIIDRWNHIMDEYKTNNVPVI